MCVQAQLLAARVLLQQVHDRGLAVLLGQAQRVVALAVLERRVGAGLEAVGRAPVRGEA